MDEDERLLASEEGKKLSSKERRQLRNKVSARAFRSRRKGMSVGLISSNNMALDIVLINILEYIGQLESEVAQKTNEANELRHQNRALFEENARLTDLARMLLSSPNLSQFLDDANLGGLQNVQAQLPQQAQQQQQPQQPQHAAMSQPGVQQANLPKEANPSHGQQEFQMQQQNSHMGMMVVPSQVDVSAMNMNNGSWNTGIEVSF